MKNGIWLYRLYDTAEEFYLDKAEEVLAKEKQISRLKFTRIKPKSIIIENPPVSVNMGALEVNLEKWKLNACLTVKIYEIGVISLILKIDLPEKISFNELKELSAYLYSSKEIAEIFKDQLKYMKKSLAGTFEESSRETYMEDFTIYFFKEWDSSWNPVPLLLAEKEDLSKQVTDETMLNSFSYGKNDLAVITWDSALVYDAEESTDIPDILEFALSELLELRYYDGRLSRRIDIMYEDIKKAGAFGWLTRLSRYRRINKALMELVADISKVTEKIQNSLKVTEDVFYARVYTAALNIFKTQNWSNSIQHKISVIRQTYQMLASEIENSRATFLEAVIVFLIIFEIVIMLLEIK